MKNKLNHLIASQYFSFFVTVLLFIILYGAGIAIYKGFMRPQVFLNLFIDNAALIIVTVGITFTLIIAGIDLSVGAVLALVCMVLAWLLVHTSIPVGVAVLLVMIMGTAFGARTLINSGQLVSVGGDLCPSTYFIRKSVLKHRKNRGDRIWQKQYWKCAISPRISQG